ncbi:MAG: sigma-54-dependent Fis family transcriptional regulator [Candidatus Cloacimonetes bacterium]|nr:sigma-54-dependent Fis family transcriptional regulator [Candidatus Cloacimonadota bacterium]
MTEKAKHRILIVDDSAETLDMLKLQLQSDYVVDVAQTIVKAKELLDINTYHIAIVDLVLAGENGLDLIKDIKIEQPFTSVIAISGQATIENAVTAMKIGASEFLVKPIRNLDLINIQIEKILQNQWLVQENRRLNELIHKDLDIGSIVGNSPVIQSILQKIHKIAKLDTIVLITGETGVGKSIFAELIHRNSKRKMNKFVSVNCGSLTETLLESHLFGHKKGAFTDAWRDKEGYFQEASDGTLFLDEITETSLSFQVKLLKVLETGVFRQVGGDHDLHSDARIIVATNKDIKSLVAEKLFREDLYYRLNVININIPPLSERKDDIRLLTSAFIREFSGKYNKHDFQISPAVMDILVNHEWKGNVRELKNSLEHAFILAEHSIMQPEDLPESVLPQKRIFDLPKLTEIKWAKAKEEFTRQYIVALLKKTFGNVSLVSQISGIPRENIYRKCKQLNIEPDEFRQNISNQEK